MCALIFREDLRSAVVLSQYYNTSSGWMPWQPAGAAGRAIGQGCYTTVNKGRPRVLPFSINPAQHRQFNGSSGSCFSEVNRWTGRKLVPYMRLSGDIAARLYGSAPDYLTFSPGSEQQEATISAASKLLEPDVNYGLILAEASETLDLFMSPGRTLAKQLAKLSKPRSLPKHRKTFQTSLSYAADAWLQYRYAICPTVSDISDVRDKTTRVLTPRYSFSKKGGGSKGPTSYSQEDFVGVIAGLYVSGRKTTSMETHYVSKLYYNVIDNAAAERNRLGLGISQIPGLLWEKVPFSFIVDWVIDVGSWLNAVMPKPEYGKKGQTLSQITTRTWTCNTYMASVSANMSYASPCVSTYSRVEKFYDRAINPSLPALPPVNASIMNLKRSCDSAALSWKPVQNFIKNLK